jgi:hypothetical protein
MPLRLLRLRVPAPADRRLLVEALGLIVAVRAGLRLLPFTAVRRCVSLWAGLTARAGCAPGRIVWAVGAVGSRIPGTTCLVEALAADSMLRRRGHASALKVGVRRGAGLSIDAHAWVECCGTVVIGTTPELAEYAVLSS